METTPGHPFYTDLGWVDAGDLQIGSLVMRADGSYGAVQTLEVKERPQLMYDLTVDTAHTFFVGEGEWLVHNTGCLTIQGDISSFSSSEINAAQHMADLGNTVILRTPMGQGRTSDLLVNGIPYDVYTPTTSNPNRIISAIADKNSQTQGIVLDLSNSSVNVADLGNIVARVNGTGATNITDVVIIGR